MIRCLLAAMAWAIVATASGEAAPLPPAVQRTLEQLNREVLAAQVKAYKDLNKQAIDLGKLGKLDEALIVKAEMDKVATAIAMNPAKGDAPIPTAPISAFNGTWWSGNNSSDAFIWKDGVSTGTSEYHRQSGWDKGTYTVSDDGKTVTLSVSNGKVVKFTVKSPTELLEPQGGSRFKSWVRQP